MRFKKVTPSGDTSPDATDLVYCSSCGKVADVAFKPGQFVIVDETSSRPYFGRIIGISATSNGAEATIARSPKEFERVLLEFVKPI